MKFDFHYDAGHGWLKVTIQEIKSLGIDNKISSCSYRQGNDVYLEEDCDASIFIDAFNKIPGNVSFNEIYDGKYSFVRSLNPYYV